MNTNFPPIYPIYNVDSQLQNLLLQSGIGGGRSNEDLNIISKVLGKRKPVHSTQFHTVPFGIDEKCVAIWPFD